MALAVRDFGCVREGVIDATRSISSQAQCEQFWGLASLVRFSEGPLRADYCH